MSSLTEGQFLPGVRGKGEAENSHAGYEDAGNDEVEEVVESPPAYLDGEGDVQVGGGAALVPHLVPHCRHLWEQKSHHSCGVVCCSMVLTKFMEISISFSVWILRNLKKYEETFVQFFYFSWGKISLICREKRL